MMKRLVPTILLFTLLQSVAQAHEIVDWPMFQGNFLHTGYFPHRFDPKDFSVRWKNYYTPNACCVVTFQFPIATSDKLFISNSSNFGDNYLQAIDANSGNVKWQTNLKGYNSLNGPSFDAGKLYLQAVNSKEQGLFLTYDAKKGNLLNTAYFDSQWNSYLPATIYNHEIFISGTSSHDTSVYKFTSSGERIWGRELTQYVYDMMTPAVNDKYIINYSAFNGRVIRPFHGGDMNVLDRKKGKLLFKISDPNYNWQGYSANFAPVFDEKNQIVLGIEGGYLTAYDLNARAVKYSISGFTSQPALAEGIIYVVGNKKLFALDEKTGKKIWDWDFPNQGFDKLPPIIAPIVTKNLIFISTTLNTYAIDLNTHQTVWQFNAGGLLAVNKNSLFIVSRNTGLTFAINLTTNKLQ